MPFSLLVCASYAISKLYNVQKAISKWRKGKSFENSQRTSMYSPTLLEIDNTTSFHPSYFDGLETCYILDSHMTHAYDLSHPFSFAISSIYSTLKESPFRLYLASIHLTSTNKILLQEFIAHVISMTQ